jgi:class 3 adenylate cyclase/CHASE2 domain-containing sensor protein
MAQSRSSQTRELSPGMMTWATPVIRAMRRRRLALAGLLLTILVICLEFDGCFARIDQSLYDLRVNYCQFQKPQVAPLLHVDIDDGSIESIGGWPWRRGIIAEGIDELHLAGAKVIAMDVLFSESQDLYNPEAQARGTSATIEPSTEDAKLARSIERAKVILPFSAWSEVRPEDEVDRRMREVLSNSNLVPALDIAPHELAEKIRGMISPTDRLEERVAERYARQVSLAMFHRARDAISSGNTDYASLAKTLLPKDTALLDDSPLQHMLRRKWLSAYAVQTLNRFWIGRQTDARLRETHQLLAPIPALGRAAGGVGFTDYLPSRDGVVRSVPLLVQYTEQQQVFPQLGLAIACAMNGIEPGSSGFKIRTDAVVLSSPEREIIIPVHDRATTAAGEPVPFSFDIPWVGGRDWRHMYDSRGEGVDLHMPFSELWQIRKAQEFFHADSMQLLEVMQRLHALRDPDPIPQFSLEPAEDARLQQFRAGLTNDAAVVKAVTACRQSLAALKGRQSSGQSLTPDDVKRLEEDTAVVEAFDKLPELMRHTIDARDYRNTWRAGLRKRVAGKAVIIGWTATGAIADFVPTSIHAACPGAVAHGVIYNAIMTGQMWNRMPRAATYGVILLLGLITTLFVIWLRPAGAFWAAILLFIAYLLVNGVVLFGTYRKLLDLGGPVMSILIVWAGCSVVYAAQRFRISKALGVYVDPSLIDYVQENAEEDIFEGRIRELTVVFSDLEGFTGLTERLKENVTRLLSEYMGEMIPVIQQNNGLVHKLLGDGIMFSFGALRDDPDHAANAMRGVLRMQAALSRFNAKRLERHNRDNSREEFHELKMRCGISSGRMTAGNAGPKEFKDFTVLGDMVNLAARLEAANKACGTRNLVTGETFRRTQPKDFILMPIGMLKVRGRKQSVMVYELLGEEIEDADKTDPDLPQKRQMIELMASLVNLFDQRQFDLCQRTILAINEQTSAWPWAKRYQGLLDRYREQCDRLAAISREAAEPFIEIS